MNEENTAPKAHEPLVQKAETTVRSRMRNIFRGPVRIALYGVIFIMLGLVGMSLVGDQFVSEVVQEAQLPTATSTYVAVNLPAPQFFLPDGSGKIVGLTEYRGSLVVLVFWASWNTASLDQIQVLSRSTLPPDVVLLAINTQEDAGKAKNAIERGKYNVNVLYDEEGGVGERYTVKNLPTLYFIDRTGSIRSILSGVSAEKSIIEHIEAMSR